MIIATTIIITKIIMTMIIVMVTIIQYIYSFSNQNVYLKNNNKMQAKSKRTVLKPSWSPRPIIDRKCLKVKFIKV